MGIFSARLDPRDAGGRAAGPTDVSDPRGRMGIPVGFEAVVDALEHLESPLPACEAVGREMALDGASADEALEGLRTVWQALRGEDPSYDAVAALVRSWSDVTLRVVNQVSCDDPMTGLSSAAHLRTSLSALYRGLAHGGTHPRESHALVLLDVAHEEHRPRADAIGRALRLATLGETVRTVFPAGEVVARLAVHRIAVLTRRDSRLGTRVGLLRRLVEGASADRATPRVWIEGLPASDLATGILVDELARG